VGFLRAFLFSLFLLSVGLLARTSPAASRRLIRTASSSSSIILLLGGREHQSFSMAWVPVVELEHLLELLAQASVCLPS
jgi:hypothetical protein